MAYPVGYPMDDGTYPGKEAKINWREKMSKIKVISGDYSSKNKDSLLKRCEAKQTDYNGYLHAGIIHYIQGKMPDFTLKAGIAQILDNCPKIWPEDLPELIDKDKYPQITEAMEKELQRLNKGLLIPIDGTDIVEIIRLAKEFLRLEVKDES